MSDIRVRERRGTWRRHLCEWFGHRNIGISDLITGESGVACLRCWAVAIVIDTAQEAPDDPR